MSNFYVLPDGVVSMSIIILKHVINCYTLIKTHTVTLATRYVLAYYLSNHVWILVLY